MHVMTIKQYITEINDVKKYRVKWTFEGVNGIYIMTILQLWLRFSTIFLKKKD